MNLTIENGISEHSSAGNAAVCIRNLCKRYDHGPPVLQNFCMNVLKGSIYGLLGSSGCGKTTILSCIVGLKKWDAGDVLVFGKTPGSKGSGVPGKVLGYMPQELALYNQLSIREVIQFYGRIYSMTENAINEQFEFLNSLLQLPTGFKLVGDLSGGQKRRASLALALIHSPKLLVLDEPTVGLDPVLRRNIWNHLFKIVSTSGTTILITTHYIEEARFSNTIGIMRNGKLLVEDSPAHLLQTYNCEFLESVVLQLCRKDERSSKSNSSSTTESQPDELNAVTFKSSWSKRNNLMLASTKSESSCENGNDFMNSGVYRNVDAEASRESRRISCQNDRKCYKNGLMDRVRDTSIFQALQRIYGLVMVIILTFTRHPGFLILILWIPSIQGAMTLWAIGSKPKEMTLGVINHELANWTATCSLLNSSESLCDISSLSCKYINRLNEDTMIALKPYETEELALVDVRKGKSWGYLVFPENFTQHSIDRAVAKQFALEDSLEGSRVHVHLDHSEYLASLLLVKHLMHSYQDFIRQLVNNCDFGGRELEIPLFYRAPVYGSDDEKYTDYTMPGVILCSLYGIVSGLTALLFIGDRRQGTLSRAYVAGLGTADVMIAYLTTQAIVTLIQITLWNGVLHFVFGFEILGSRWICLVYCLLIGLSGAGMGLFTAVNCETEVQALAVAIFLVPVYLLYGGIVYPLETMSYKFAQYIGYSLPICLPTISVRSVVVRGLGLTHPLVWSGFPPLLAWVIVLPILSAIIYKRSYK